jgi:phosphoesterase RecJ-like protein
MRYKAHLLQQAKAAHGGRLLYAILYPEEVRRFGLELSDTENIIDFLRMIDGVEIACLLQPGENGIRFSLRGRSGESRVDAIARRLGGGGHELAAGAEVENMLVAEAEEMLIKLTQEVFGND